MLIENLQTDINSESYIPPELNQFHSNQPQQQLNFNQNESPNETLNIAEVAIPPRKVEEPPTDYRDPDLVEYFRSKEVLGRRWHEMSSNLISTTGIEVNNQIKSGVLKISNQSKEIGKPSSSPTLADKPDQIKLILSKKADLEMQLKSIQEELNKMSESREAKTEEKDEFSQIQHKNFIERMVKVRKVAENKRKQLLQYQQQKLLNQIEKEEEERKLSQEKLKQSKEKAIKQKLQERQRLKQKQLQQQKQSLKRYKQVVQQKRKHEIMKEKYEASFVLPMLEQQKKILKERSSRLKGFSIEEIRNFEREYDRSKEEKMSQHSNSSNLTFEYKPPPYYSHKIHKLLQEEKVKEKIRLQAEKRALEQRIEKQANYAQYVKQTISVKIDQKKKLQMLLLNKQKRSKQKTKVQRFALGNKYLHEKRVVKSELRKDNYSTKQEKTESSPEQKKKSNTTMNQGELDKFMREAHKDRINKILASKNIEKMQKIDRLKIEANRLTERIRRNEEIRKVKPVDKESGQNLEELLASIKLKIGMIDLLTQ